MAGEEEFMLQKWQECLRWMNRIKFIREDHRLNTSSCTLKDFAIFFKDGVILCKLLHHIDPTSIDMSSVSLRPHNAQILYKKNIKKFLTSCSKHFKLRELDLFVPEHLYDFTDFGRVLETLSKLSTCPKVLELYFEGFQLSPQGDEEEEVYRSLQDMAHPKPHSAGRANDSAAVNGDCSSLLTPDDGSLRGAVGGRPKGDEVYFSILYVQSQFKDTGRVPKDKRELCLQELLETEHGYVKALKNLVNMFLKPLSEMLPQQQIDIIFFKLKVLADVHQYLQYALTDAYNTASSSSSSSSLSQAAAVAKVFIKLQDRLLVYGEYCAHYLTSQALLDDITATNPTIRDKVKESEAAMSAKRHQLRDLLFVPVQRILKYPLLLQEMIKHSNQRESEISHLQDAYDAMVDIAEYANEFKRDRETIKILEDVQASITDLPPSIGDLKELGRMRLDGEIKIECHPEKNKLRFVFLFDKALIMCKQSKDEKYLYKDSIMLDGCKVDTGGSSSITSITAALTGGGSLESHFSSSTLGGSRKSISSNSFLLVTSGNKKAYTIIAKNENEKDRWLEAVTCAIESVNPPENTNSSHSFTLTTFTENDVRCSHCQKLMKGVLYQGYSCAECHSSVHRQCLSDYCSSFTCEPYNERSNDNNNGRWRSCGGAISPPPPQNTIKEWAVFFTREIRDMPWWAEKMCRDRAEEELLPTRQGTFLMRWSEKHCQPVVSLKVSTEVKHMRIHQDTFEGTTKYFFNRACKFSSLYELVQYFHTKALSEAFQELEERLLFPIYDSAISVFEFTGSTSPNAASPSAHYLHLSPGQRLVVMGRQAEDRGWWSGRSGNKIGFFPKDFVKIENPPIICP